MERHSLMSLTSRLMADSDMMASWAWGVQLALGQGGGHQEWSWALTRTRAVEAFEAFERIKIVSEEVRSGPKPLGREIPAWQKEGPV